MYRLSLVLCSVLSFNTLADEIHSKYVPKGYELVTSSEFNYSLNDNYGNSLWLDKYLPHWTKTGIESQAKYDFNNGNLRLIITEDQKPWDKEHDGQTIISGIQTANKNLLHRWNDSYPKISDEVFSPQEQVEYHLQKYGYFELRAKPYKTIKGGGIHSAWWMIGFQEDSNAFIDQLLPNGLVKPRTLQAAEVDIFEILGRNTKEIPSAFHSWGGLDNLKWIVVKQPNIDTAKDFHIYGFLWTPQKMELYFDGELIAFTQGTVQYPMLTLLGFYEKRDRFPNPWTGILTDFTYPKYFEIDYWRSYMPTNMINIENEAEYATLGDTAITKQYSKASNSYIVSNLGYGNSLSFKYIYTYLTKKYEMEIVYISDSDRDILLSINNGIEKKISVPNSNGKISSYKIEINLDRGFNTILFKNDHNLMPDIDLIRINKLE